jgi:WD40 repeat protein
MNERAIGCLNSHRSRNVVILPGKTENSIQIYDSDAENQMEYDLGEIPVLLAYNIHADIFAYANKKGYTINLHKIGDGKKYHTYTRGSSAADVTSIAFDKYWFRMAVGSSTDTIHVFSLPKELALNGKSAEEVKCSIATYETEESNAKSIPPSMLASVTNPTAGMFSKFFGSSGEKSYLKVYISSPEKHLAINHDKLLILTHDGNLHSIKINCKGSHDVTSDEVHTFDMYKQETPVE